jgi:hypothetical protein
MIETSPRVLPRATGGRTVTPGANSPYGVERHAEAMARGGRGETRGAGAVTQGYPVTAPRALLQARGRGVVSGGTRIGLVRPSADHRHS